MMAQITNVHGRVFDALTNEPVPFAAVFFNGASGTTTDDKGFYKLQTDRHVDSVSVNYIGYLPAAIRVAGGKTQEINFALRQNKFDLPDVVVVAGENPADIIMKKVIENKPKHNSDNLDAFQYESYNKLEFDINNITEKFKNNKLFKPFRFIFDNVDSTSTNKKPYLPVFIAETVSDVYHRKNPSGRKEVIKANKISGVENETVTSYLGDFYSHINVYDNYIYLFSKGFVSPVAGFGSLYYKYYLYDSTFIGNKWCYRIKFKPRRKQELTFSGEMWINDSTYAIKKINMRIADDANINYIEDLAFVDEFDCIDNTFWMLKKEVLVLNIAADETIQKEPMGFIGRKTTYYSNYVINKPMPSRFYGGGTEVEVNDDSREKNTTYWDSARVEKLSKTEEKIYHMVDTIKTIPAYKRYADLITLAATGYQKSGYIEIGPIYSLYSYNSIEGSRFRLGGRTSNKFSTRLILDGYAAYGLSDLQWKYGGGIKYFISKKPWQFIGIQYTKDDEQLGKSTNALSDDNFFTTVIRRIPSNKLNGIEQEKIYIEREWFNGFSTRINYTHTTYSPLGVLDFTYYVNDAKTDSSNALNTSEVSLYMRFAYKERFVTGKVNRISLGSDYPITRIQYSRGLKGLSGSNFSYHKLNIKVDDNVYLGNFGILSYRIEAGKIWGTLPYPLLTVHPGNQSYTYDETAFNLMNYYEFVSDQFASVQMQHHFGGIFLDRIPLLRKLKWREVVTGNALIGHLDDNNRQILSNPNAFYTLSKPYTEVGAGIENIFKILRIDGVWRLSYRDNPNTPKFGLRASISLAF